MTLVKRLRCGPYTNGTRLEAADRLEALEGTNRDLGDYAGRLVDRCLALEAALRPFAHWSDALGRDFPNHEDDIVAGGVAPHYITFGMLRAASVVLKQNRKVASSVQHQLEGMKK